MALPELTPFERSLLARAVAAEIRVKELEDEISLLRNEIDPLRKEAKRLKTRYTPDTALKNRLDHAVRELGKQKPGILSDEEWRAVMVLRGVCDA